MPDFTVRIAIIDDDKMTGIRLQDHLVDDGYPVDVFEEGESFVKSFMFAPYDLVITDMMLPGMNGFDILKTVKEKTPKTEVLVITGYGTVDSAIEAIKAGAFHYVTKPIRLDEFDNLLSQVIEKIKMRTEMSELRAIMQKNAGRDGMIGTSREMVQVFGLVDKVAPLDCPVIIYGQSGTGKELVARAIHRLSLRHEEPIVSLNCGGFSPELIANELFGHEKSAFSGAFSAKIGLLESANHGTVLLDEIAEMPADMQVKLLRVLQEGQIFRLGSNKPTQLDIRIIAASNRDLQEEVKAGRFREDLYFRLNVMTINLPGLKDRQGDLQLLADHFLHKYNQSYGKNIKGFAAKTMNALELYDYPGNVRELENIIARSVALSDGDFIELQNLPQNLVDACQPDAVEDSSFPCLEDVEKKLILKVLRSVNGQREKAAAILGITRTTLWRKIKKYNIDL